MVTGTPRKVGRDWPIRAYENKQVLKDLDDGSFRVCQLREKAHGGSLGA